MVDDDARDLAIHDAIDHLAKQIMRANGFSRRQALERFVAFAENDEESPVFAQPSRPKRRRRALAEAHA